MNTQPKQNDRYKDYIPVSVRVAQFNDEYTGGRIVTAIVEHDREAGFVLVRAEVYRNTDDAQPAATGHAYESKTTMNSGTAGSYIEIAETSAVGRALAFLGFETKRGIASREDMQNRTNSIANVEPIGRAAQPPSPPKPTVIDENARARLAGLNKIKAVFAFNQWDEREQQTYLRKVLNRVVESVETLSLDEVIVVGEQMKADKMIGKQ